MITYLCRNYILNNPSNPVKDEGLINGIKFPKCIHVTSKVKNRQNIQPCSIPPGTINIP